MGVQDRQPRSATGFRSSKGRGLHHASRHLPRGRRMAPHRASLTMKTEGPFLPPTTNCIRPGCPHAEIVGAHALLTTRELAEVLAISERTVKRLGIPHFKVGRQVRYDARSVNRWLE